MIVATRALLAEAEREDDPINGINARMFRFVAHVSMEGDRRTPPADWRATYPFDDPSYEPDLWIADLAEPTIWCKASSEPEYGEILTFMLPSDY